MKTILIVVSIFLSALQSFGQYKWTNRFYVDSLYYNPNESVSGRFAYTGFQNNFRIFQKVDTGIRTKLVVKNILLPDLTLSRADTMDWEVDDFRIITVSSNQFFDLVASYQEYIIFDRTKRTTTRTIMDTSLCHFDNALLLDDRHILLYQISNFHPADGFAGVNMAIYDIEEQELTAKKKYSFSAIAISHLINQWLCVLENRIYVVSPLTGQIYIHSAEDLGVLDSFQLEIPFRNYQDNLNFNNYLDSLVSAEGAKVKTGIQTGTNIESFIYQGGFFHDISEITHKKHDYIEKLIPIDDTTILLTIARAGSEFNYRDLLFLNIPQRKIARKIENWKMFITEKNPEKFEDIFPVHLSYSSFASPYITNNRIYNPAFLHPGLFHTAGLDSVLRKLIRENRQNKFSIKVVEYKY